MKIFDTIIVGAGPGGIFTALELVKNNYKGSIAVIDSGNSLEKRKCPIDGNKVKSCVHCKSCSIMNGFGGAGAFSDGKYTITNDFGGTLSEYVGKEKALELMNYVDSINQEFSTIPTKLYSSANSSISKKCTINKLHLLDASIRHLGTDQNYVILENIYNYLVEKNVSFIFNHKVTNFELNEGIHHDAWYNQRYHVIVEDEKNFCEILYTDNLTFSIGRSGSKAMEKICKDHDIATTSNHVDIGVRVELDASIFDDITDELYEGKIVYVTEKYGDKVRTFCMNPHGAVVSENTNGIVTVNGHSYEAQELKTKNTNFALLVSKHLTEPFNDSTGYGESIARLSNMLGGGVLVQRFGDLIKGQRSTQARIAEGFITPTLSATPGDLSLVLPKRILDDIIEMIYALDKIAPGTANDDTLLYGVEVKFYNMKVDVNTNLETKYKGLYVIGDGSGVTHSLAQASASGIHVARHILEENK